MTKRSECLKISSLFCVVRIELDMGKSIILLRGLGRDARHWGEFPKLIATAMPEFKIHTIDLPGTGEFYDIKSQLSIKAIAEFMDTEASKKNMISDETYIVGLSLGGMVTAEWSHIRPGKIKKIIMVNSSFSNWSRFYHRLSHKVYYDFIAMFFMSTKRREETILKIVSSNTEQYEKVSKAWQNLWKTKPFKVSTVIRQLVAASIYKLKNLPQQPVLFLASEQDKLVSPQCYRDIQRHTDWPVISHPTAGHEMPMDEPEWVIEQIKAFLG